MKLVKVHYTNPVAWLFMPQVLQRARDFSDKFELDFNADLIEEAIRLNFVVNNPQYLTLASVEGSKAVGHLVASIDTLTDFRGQPVKRYLTILQAEHDSDHKMSDDFRKAALEVCKEWAKTYSCDAIQILCEGEWRKRLFRDRYGFKEHKTLMKMEIN